MTQSPTGGPAQTIYQVTSRAGVVGHDAQRVVIVTDGRAAEGGPQQAVYFVSDAEIAAGDFIVTGNKPLPIVQVGAAGVEYPPIAVYDVTGKPDDVQPPQEPVAPQFSTAEVGTVNASTVAVTFDLNMSATGDDYSSGVTIKVNGSTRNFESGIRQANHALVYYALATPVQAGDAVTWEYSAAAGSIVSESDGTPLADVTAQTVTNNVAPADPIGDALRADAVAYYRFEANGSDATTRGNDLNPQNAPSYVAGKVGNAVRLARASNQYLSRTSGADLNLGNQSIYYALWVKLLSKDSKSEIVDKERGGSNVYGLSYDSTNDIFTFSSLDLGKICEGWSLNPVDVSTWYFVEFYFNASSGKMDIAFNNSSFGSDTVNANIPPADSDGDYLIGLQGLTYSDIDIDEVGVWRRILTQDERNYLWNGGAGRALFP